MNAPSPSQLRDFIFCFLGKERSIAEEEKERFAPFFTIFQEKEKSLAEVVRKEAPHYNLFEVLRIRHYEVKVHTPFLANLLNPYGSHSQGRIFYDSFFRNMLGEEADEHTHIEVRREERNDFGQIDIEIRYRVEGRSRSVVIENKIYHHDGEKQLWRYYQALRARGMTDADLRLVYLTLDGKDPDVQSMGYTPPTLLTCISYRLHIAQWLSALQPELPENAVYHTIRQYIKTIQSL